MTNSKIIEIVTFLSQPDVHLVDPIKMLEVSAEHEDGKEVDTQFWIVHVSKRKNETLMQNKSIFGN